jgi:hypothetical protein
MNLIMLIALVVIFAVVLAARRNRWRSRSIDRTTPREKDEPKGGGDA